MKLEVKSHLELEHILLVKVLNIMVIQNYILKLLMLNQEMLSKYYHLNVLQTNME